MATGKRTFRAFVLRTSRSSWVVTPTLTLSSAAQSASLQFGPAAVGQSKAGRANLTPVLARFSPARPAREVVLQRYASGRWSSVTTSRQDRTGKATFLALPGGDTRSYRDWVRLAAALTAAPEGTARTDAALGLISIATDLDDRSPQSSPGRSSGPRSPYPAMVSAADAHPHGGKIRS